MTFDETYLTGRVLYGDDLVGDELLAWHNAEREGYADLGAKHRTYKDYGYHALNSQVSFSRVREGQLGDALGVGSGLGGEFLPLVGRLSSLTILDPSTQTRSSCIGSMVPTYVSPNETGIMPFDDASFDLVVCMGVLHHIPNVSTVVREAGRVLRPNGQLVIREPIVSMGDWRKPRIKLTANERGIPLHLLRQSITEAGLHIRHESLFGFPITRLIARRLGIRHVYNSPTMVLVDRFLATASRPHYRYHARTTLDKLRPTQAGMVATKPAR